MGRKEHVIWQNINIDETQWLDDDGNQMETSEIYYLSNIYLDAERCNLDICLENPILVIANLGLWNGRATGYQVINSGNIKDILYSNADYIKWYSDGHNIKCVAHHHDGTNYYEYREIKNMNTIDKLLDMLYNNITPTRRQINHYTRSIEKHVRNVYGWR